MDSTEIIRALELQKDAIRRKAEDEISALEKVISSFQTNYMSGNGNPKLIQHSSQATNPSNALSDRQKIANVIKHSNKFLKVGQIAERLHELEPKISVETWKRKASPALSFLKKSSGLHKITIGNVNQNTFWGSKNWLDGQGNIKPEHKYDVSQLAIKNSEPIEI